MKRNRVLSGVRASGDLHLGNYLGAMRQWIDMQREHDCYFFIADLHGLTELSIGHNAEEFRDRRLTTAATFIASGIDPTSATLFFQSDVRYHTELLWYLSAVARKGELERMTQWKDKAGKDQAGASAGLFTYPILMAADILMYNADEVPVGDDQRQHVEVARDWAERFNTYAGETFVVPKSTIPKQGARIMDLLSPSRKMAKSETGAGTLFLGDSNDVLIAKVMRAVTDADTSIVRSREKPGITNLINLYAALTYGTPEKVEVTFDGRRYGDFKRAVADVVVATIEPIRERTRELLEGPEELRSLLDAGAVQANAVAGETCGRVRQAIGLY
jgi:tryptophanyl-tRNA synthetase